MSGTQTDPVAERAAAEQRALLGLFNQLWGDPEVGETVRKRAKAINPQIAIPDDNPVAVAVNRRLEATATELAALKAEREAEKTARIQAAAESSLRASIGRAQDRFKLTEEGTAGVIKLMQERQIADAEAAAALYVDSLPKAKPSGNTNFVLPGKMNLFGTTSADEQWRDLHENQDKFWADTVNSVMSEYAGG